MARERHGMSKTPIYRIWQAMVRRCRDPRVPSYPNYGGRGITVCERWQSFAAFYADMGERPEGRSLDRRDNDGPYSPDNCRWATPTEQNENRRPASSPQGQRGAEHYRTQLTDDDVRAMRTAHADGSSLGELSERYGVQKPAVHRIVHRERWAHVA